VGVFADYVKGSGCGEIRRSFLGTMVLSLLWLLFPRKAAGTCVAISGYLPSLVTGFRR
jgi:hypothetical protein